MCDKRFVYETSPMALKENTINGEKYRFTILRPSLIRLEYNEQGVFEDRASQTVFFRDFPKTEFFSEYVDGILKVETENLVITYVADKMFAPDTLSIKLKIEPASCWNFGEEFEDLGGTAKTLDEANGSILLGRGVCSRNGFSILNDSNSMLLNGNGWVETRNVDSVDYYFFGYGFQYLNAVKDYYRLTGVPPMLPAYALGNWWSRYNKYTQEEYQKLIENFEQEAVPFSVSVVDMDWHLTDIDAEVLDGDKNSVGWTGYTWNKELFPDYKAFLKFLKEHNLKTALNLHPAQGVRCHEEMYDEMAIACGIDPKSMQRIPFDILSMKFMEKYFDILHHPYEEAGVDFWWMDWQQGTSYWWIHEANKDGELKDEREVLDPLWMLNHLHIADIKRNGKRPMFFSRYSGPGSQRYPVGFSGDTYVTWESLDFQPYFTATASNIGYSWWSHDIGGHMGGYRDDELTIRWIQLGVFSPINRLHSTNTEFIRKEPWCFEKSSEHIIKNWLRLRHRLFPYLYTMNYRNHTELLPLVQPMYYNYPKSSAAYEMKNQFLFGSELMVAPITKPNSKMIRRGSVDVWFPKGEWFDFFSGLRYTSKNGRKMSVHRELQEYPVFAKAGAIIPMQNSYQLEVGNSLEVVIFPGESNCFTLYEDAGEGCEFESGDYAKTEMRLQWGETPSFVVKPAKGNLALLPECRNWKFVLRGYHKDLEVKVRVDNKIVDTKSEYDEQTHSIVLSICVNRGSEIQLQMMGNKLITENEDVIVRCTDLLQKAQCDVNTKMTAYRIVTDATRDVYSKTAELNQCCANGIEYAALLSALKELYLLTEER